MNSIFLLFIIATICIFIIRQHKIQQLIMLAVPVIALYFVWHLPDGTYGQFHWLGLDIGGMRVDKLARIFAIIFCLAAFLVNIYSLHIKDLVQQIATLIYAAAAIGAVFAPDFISLFFYWELTALASCFLIFARRTTGAYYVAMRYLIIQITSGLLLLGGAVLLISQNNNADFVNISQSQQWPLAVWLIFFAFGIKSAFPLLHNWLQDSYPSATITGAVALSAFSTKMAIYCLARGFAGTEWLIYIGAIMTLFPIFFAEIENDLRRVLAYSLNNQLGFMIVGIGIGTPLALNGTAAHAFCHILYKALLFMSIGAVMYRTGTAKASELGGLYKYMPITALCCLVGAASISAFPLFSGFISKSLILSASAKEHYFYVWLVLVFASAGVLSHSGIKIPYCAFFSHNSGKRPKEAPTHMLLAMITTALLCIFIGTAPQFLYALLPYEINYVPYSTAHVLSQMQLLCSALLAFFMLKHIGYYVVEKKSVNLDFDWLYRYFAPRLILFFVALVKVCFQEAAKAIKIIQEFLLLIAHNAYKPNGKIATQQSGGTMALWIAILLGLALFLSLLDIGSGK